MNDLFGQPVAEPIYRITPSGRKVERSKQTASGYAARPGTGPADQSCRTCANSVCRRLGNRYWKCALMRHCWKGSIKTDIRLSSPACERWQPHPPCTSCQKPLTSPTATVAFNEATGELVKNVCEKCAKRIRGQKKESTINASL